MRQRRNIRMASQYGPAFGDGSCANSRNCCDDGEPGLKSPVSVVWVACEYNKNLRFKLADLDE